MRVPSRKNRSAQNVVVRSPCTERLPRRRGLDLHNASKTYFARTLRNKMVTVIKTFRLDANNVYNVKCTLHIYTYVSAYLYIYMYIYTRSLYVSVYMYARVCARVYVYFSSFRSASLALCGDLINLASCDLATRRIS